MSCADLPPSRTHVVLVYSDDAAVRSAVRTAVGWTPAADLGSIDWVECPTAAQVLQRVDAGGVDVAILDGEAWPTGGMGLAKQMKDELPDCPHTMVLIARREDTWLATWSLADAVVPQPTDPGVLTDALVGLLRARESALPVRRAAPLGR